MKKLLALFLVLGFVASVSGCETVRGMGQDLENTGDNIQGAVGNIDEPAEEME